MPDYGWAEGPDWKEAWNEVMALVGTDVMPDYLSEGADELERSVIRRYLEPLELDCPLHYDREVAVAHGYPDIIAPYSGCATWVSPPLWQPGEGAYYKTDNRNELPAFRVITFPHIGPDVAARVATDIETEFYGHFILGDKPYKKGCTLLACSPKESGVGRGAFLTWESDVMSREGALLAQIRTSLYYYVPRSLFEDASGEGE